MTYKNAYYMYKVFFRWATEVHIYNIKLTLQIAIPIYQNIYILRHGVSMFDVSEMYHFVSRAFALANIKRPFWSTFALYASAKMYDTRF